MTATAIQDLNFTYETKKPKRLGKFQRNNDGSNRLYRRKVANVTPLIVLVEHDEEEDLARSVAADIIRLRHIYQERSLPDFLETISDGQTDMSIAGVEYTSENGSEKVSAIIALFAALVFLVIAYTEFTNGRLVLVFPMVGLSLLSMSLVASLRKLMRA